MLNKLARVTHLSKKQLALESFSHDLFLWGSPTTDSTSIVQAPKTWEQRGDSESHQEGGSRENFHRQSHQGGGKNGHRRLQQWEKAGVWSREAALWASSLQILYIHIYIYNMSVYMCMNIIYACICANICTYVHVYIYMWGVGMCVYIW